MAQQCLLTDELIVKIGDDLANIMMEMGLEDLSSSLVKDRFRKLLASYNEYIPLEDVVQTVVDNANEYGLMGDTALFFADAKEIENIIKDAGKLNYIHNQDNTDEKLLDANRNVLAKEAKKDFLIKAYGTATDVRLKAEKEASIALVNAILIDRINGRVVTSIDDLNNNLRAYQQELLNTIVSYLKEYYANASALGFDTSIFDDVTMYEPDGLGGWTYTKVLDRLDAEIQKILSRDRFPDGTLEELAKAPENSFEARKLKAYNAWQMLSHFDSLIKIKYGDALEVANFGDMLFTGENKYRRADKGAHNKTSWRNSDEIKLNEEVDSAIQELVNSTPLLRYGSDSQLGYLQFGDFSDILSRIKELVYEGSDYVFEDKVMDFVSPQTWSIIKGKSIKQLINRFRLNPQRYLSAVFEVLSNQDMFDELSHTGMFNGLTITDKNIIYSIHKGITSSVDSTSINNIAGTDKQCSIYEEMAQACDSIFKINFLQYYTGQDGVTKVRNMSNTRLDTLLRNIRQTIKTKNHKSVPGQFTENGDGTFTIKGAVITPNFVDVDGYNRLMSIKFKIPNTNIEVRLNAGTGDVSYIINGRAFRSLTKNNNFTELLDFVSNVLGQNITEDTLTNMYDNQVSTNLTQLVNFASRVIFNSFVSNHILKGFNSVSTMKQRLVNMFGENAPRIDTNMKEIDLIHSKDINTIESLANAVAVEQGLLSSSQIKSGSGSSQSQQSLSRLLGGVQSQLELQNRNADSATRDSLILDTRLLKGIFTAREYYDLTNTKDHTKFNVNEFATSMFLHDFIGGLIPKQGYNALLGNGTIALLPSVNSDKNTIGRMLIDLNYEVTVNGEKKTLRNLTPADFEVLICNELGGIYQKTVDKINSDFQTILAGSGQQLHYTAASFDAFNERHKILDPVTGEWTGKYDSARALSEFIKNYNLTHRHAPISITDQIHFIENKDGSIKPNKTILHYIDQFVTEPNLFGSFDTLHQFMQHKKADIIGSLLRANFKIDLTKNSKETSFLLDSANLDQSWVDSKHGQMIIGRVNIGGVTHNIRTKTDLNNIRKVLSDVVNAKLVELGNTVNANLYDGLMRKAVKLPSDLEQIQRLEETDEIRAYKKLQELANRVNNSDYLYDPQIMSDLEQYGVVLELNPLIEKYNYLDYLFTQEFMIATVGTLAAHPIKKDDGNVEHEEAGRYNAQHKRNVSYTATMQEFTLGLLNGIPSDYNIAIVDDIKDIQYNVSGDVDDGIKPFDGATFVNPFIVYLENVSLGAAKAGITKKQFVHFYDEKTGSGGIIKTAGFGITNDWMRNSPMLQKMMKKMTDGKWFGPNGEPIVVDITSGFNGNINVPYYFRKNGKYYKVTQILNKGNNEYDIIGSVVDVYSYDGALKAELYEIGEEVVLNDLFSDVTNVSDNGVTIDSNYILWNVFGGKDSVKLHGTDLIPSEDSIKNVVKAMNSIGVDPNTGAELTDEQIANIRTQDDVYQPLKHSDIHYIPTAGAVKQGAANINKKNLYHDDQPLNFMKIHMYQAGIQLDKEHHADGSELSLMTQVINACAHKGYSLDDSMEMFSALRTLTDVGTSALLDPIREYVKLGDEESQKKVVEAVVNTVIKALSKQSMSENDLLSVFASELIEKVKEGKTLTEQDFLTKLPKDNPAVYAKFMSTMSVFLTNSGIKMKIPGILSVLTPSYNIMQLYTIPAGKNPDGTIKYKTVKWEQIEYNLQGLSGQEYLNSIQEEFAPKVFEVRNINGALVPTFYGSNLQIGKTYVIDGQSVKITTPRQRKQIKQDILNGKYNSVVQDLRVGHELGNYDVVFKGTPNGEVESEFTLWDLDSIQALFELKEVLDTKDPLLKGQMLMELNRKYAHILPAQNMTAKDIEKALRKIVREDTAVLSPNGKDFVSKDSVLIDGKEVLVNKSTIKTQAYELVLPKIFINEFGLDTNTQLTDVADDPDFFTKSLLENIRPTADEENYTVALLNGSRNKFTGKLNHYYLVESLVGTSGLQEVKMDKFQEDGKLYRIDTDGNHIYELSSENDKLYVDESGNEIILTDNIEFYINHLNYTTAKISSEVFGEDIINAFANSSNKSAKKFYKFLTSNNIDSFNSGLDEEAVSKENLSAMQKMNDSLSSSINIHSDHPMVAYLRTLGMEMHSSFLKSLEVVASRTPSQSMQSFMPMKIVAFDNPNVNTAFVSTAQIWLQGSDYDVDAVSVATYDIDKSGRMQLWSPYSDLSSLQRLNESLNLPFPTGKEVVISEPPKGSIKEINAYRQEAYEAYHKLFATYGALFKDRAAKSIHLELVDNPDLNLLAQFINEINKTGLYGIDDAVNTKLCQELGYSPDQIGDFRLHDAIAEIVNKHNKYLDKVNHNTLTSIAKNYSMYKMYKVIDTPLNLIQAQSSVDAMTGPIKNITKDFKVGQLIAERGPGNVFDKAESIEDNQVGKDGISICAVGMKTFFGLTAYYNHIANYGTEEEKARIKLGSGGRGITLFVPGEHKARKYEYFANINPKLNSDMYELLSQVDNDTDAALVLSALLSLATDNAKELQLSKLNAGIKTLGMYIFGISIGMDFESVAKIMTSDVGLLLTELTKSNVFTGERGIFSISKVFDYLETGPRDILSKYDETVFVDGKIAQNPIAYIAKSLAKSKYDKDLNPYNLFAKFAWDSSLSLDEKIQQLENLKGRYTYISSNGKRIKTEVSKPDLLKFNQAIDELEEYLRQVNIVKNDSFTYQSLKTLSDGAEEFKILGQIFGLNKGLKTKPEETIQKVLDIQSVTQNRLQAIIDSKYRREVLNALLHEQDLPFKDKIETDLTFDIVKFCFDEEYKQKQISMYDKMKCSVNMLDAIATVPHFAGYVQSLAVNYQAAIESSKKFKTTAELGKVLIDTLGATSSSDKQNIFKGIGNYYSDYVRRAWMLDSIPPIKIPKGIKSIADGKLIDEECEIVLGTTNGDASFKYIMENVIIPELQKGSLGNGVTSEQIKENKFIKHLSSALLTSTVTHNPIIYYTLPINMLPSTDEERGVFNTYKSEFNKLLGIAYNLNGLNIPLVDLFYYYGLIAHYGKQGQQSLMPIFENLHENPNYKIADFHKFESSFNEDVPINLKTLYPYIIKTTSPYSATTDYIYTQDPETMVTELWYRVRRSEFKEDIELECEATGCSKDVAWYNILKSLNARNGYVKKVNPILRNSEVSNYFMVTEEPIKLEDRKSNDDTLDNTEQIHLVDGDHYGVIKIDPEGNVLEYSGRITGAGIDMTYSDLLQKYPNELGKINKKNINVNGTTVPFWDVEEYCEYIRLAISQEVNECGSAPY